MTQRTLIALYGNKTRGLSDLVESCQRMTAEALGDAFCPYDLRQVHATIVGLEHQEGAPWENAGFRRLRGQQVAMNIPGFLETLRASADLPFEVQIGGFGESDRPFLSRNALPFERSFCIQGDKVVVMGWPWREVSSTGGGGYPQTLDAIRRGAREFGVLHAYHRSEADRDNDLFFRIGLIDRSAVPEDAVRDLELRVRRHMSRQPAPILQIGLDDLAVAAYRDDRLPLGSTEVWPLADPSLGERLAAVLGV